MKTDRRRYLLVAALCLFFTSQAQVPILNSYPAAKATVYLDFDGQQVEGTVWNTRGPIYAQPAELSQAGVTEIFNRIAQDFLPFNLNITTDPSIYYKSPHTQRIRIIFTPTNDWYGNSGGAAFTGSFTWGDDTPGWVFTTLLGNNPKYLAASASHQIGHAMGLQHQSTYNAGGEKIAEYNGGVGDRAPIMGVGYYKNWTAWITGTSSISSHDIQDDRMIIADSPNNFGFRDNTVQELTLSSNLHNHWHLLSRNQ